MVLRLPKETSGRDLHVGSGHLARSPFSAIFVFSSVRNLASQTPTYFYVISGFHPKPGHSQNIYIASPNVLTYLNDITIHKIQT